MEARFERKINRLRSVLTELGLDITKELHEEYVHSFFIDRWHLHNNELRRIIKFKHIGIGIDFIENATALNIQVYNVGGE